MSLLLEFWIREVPQHKTIGLRALIKLSPHKCSFGELKMVILYVEKEIKENSPSPFISV